MRPGVAAAAPASDPPAAVMRGDGGLRRDGGRAGQARSVPAPCLVRGNEGLLLFPHHLDIGAAAPGMAEATSSTEVDVRPR